MSSYTRMRVPGGTYFFTVTLADRRSRLLVERVEVLRAAHGAVAAERPFRTEAIVVMPDHIHAVWTLPEGDADYSTRWKMIKARFTMGLRRAGFSPPSELPVVRSGRYAGLKPGLRVDRREVGVWQRRFWEHTVRYDLDGNIPKVPPAIRVIFLGLCQIQEQFVHCVTKLARSGQ